MYKVGFTSRMKLEVVTTEDRVNDIVGAIIDVFASSKGDVSISVTDVIEVIRDPARVMESWGIRRTLIRIRASARARSPRRGAHVAVGQHDEQASRRTRGDSRIISALPTTEMFEPGRSGCPTTRFGEGAERPVIQSAALGLRQVPHGSSRSAPPPFQMTIGKMASASATVSLPIASIADQSAPGDVTVSSSLPCGPSRKRHSRPAEGQPATFRPENEAPRRFGSEADRALTIHHHARLASCGHDLAESLRAARTRRPVVPPNHAGRCTSAPSWSIRRWSVFLPSRRASAKRKPACSSSVKRGSARRW